MFQFPSHGLSPMRIQEEADSPHPFRHSDCVLRSYTTRRFECCHLSVLYSVIVFHRFTNSFVSERSFSSPVPLYLLSPHTVLPYTSLPDPSPEVGTYSGLRVSAAITPSIVIVSRSTCRAKISDQFAGQKSLSTSASARGKNEQTPVFLAFHCSPVHYTASSKYTI